MNTNQQAQAQIQKSINAVIELAADLAANVKPRKDFDSAMSSMAFFTALPKGRQYADDFAVVSHLLDIKCIDRDVFELAIVAAGFIRP